MPRAAPQEGGCRGGARGANSSRIGLRVRAAIVFSRAAYGANELSVRRRSKY